MAGGHDLVFGQSEICVFDLFHGNGRCIHVLFSVEIQLIGLSIDVRTSHRHIKIEFLYIGFHVFWFH